MERTSLIHPFPPVCDGHSRILILGSVPSAASREIGFYYGHKRNRFWKVLEGVFGSAVPPDTEGKRRFLLAHGIALWDSIGSCTIVGSSDASIRDAVPNDVPLAACPVERIFCNGKASHACYEKYLFPITGVHAQALPSTSPANAQKSLDELIEAWRVII